MVLQKRLIRPQSNDGRNGESHWQACVASALAPVTVTLSEMEAAGTEDMPDVAESLDDEAMAVDEADEEAKGPKEDAKAEEDANIEVEEKQWCPKRRRHRWE